MSDGAQIDYAALAKQAGAISSQPAPKIPTSSSGAPKAPSTAVSSPASPEAISGAKVDYAALAKQAGAIKSTPAAPKTDKTPSEPEEGFWRGSPSVPGLPIQESTTMSPEKMKEGAVTAGKTALAGAAAGSAALGGAALLAPSAGAATVGTGILDASGAEITKDIATEGPSLARSGMNAVINMVKAHPIISSYVATHLANALGIPLPKVVKAIAGIRELAE